jgi:hypothetical protein
MKVKNTRATMGTQDLYEKGFFYSNQYTHDYFASCRICHAVFVARAGWINSVF